MTTMADLINLNVFKPVGRAELAGACPFCGGEDRFRVWLKHSRSVTGRWWCRQCGRSGDGITYAREILGMSFVEACKVFGQESIFLRPVIKDFGQENILLRGRHSTGVSAPLWSPEPETLPAAGWMKRSATIMDIFCKNLELPEALATLEYRCLTLKSARRFCLGWNPALCFDSQSQWGVGGTKKIFIPPGLVIPTLRKAGIVALKVRRSDWTKDSEFGKYHKIRGGSGNASLLIGQRGQPLVVVEGESDALLIAQEAGQKVASLALGSAKNKPSAAVRDFIKATPLLLLALDRDKAGLSACAWWLNHFPQARRVPPLRGNDILDMHKAGVPVALWVTAAMSMR